MNRRQLLKLIALGVAGQVIDSTLDLDRLLWTPKRNVIYVPHPAQLEFFNRPLTVQEKLWGIPYHESNACVGTWLGITRSTEPLPWRELLDKLTLDTKEPLYVIDKERMARDVERHKSDRKQHESKRIVLSRTSKG